MVDANDPGGARDPLVDLGLGKSSGAGLERKLEVLARCEPRVERGLIEIARDLDLLTTPYVFTPDEAAAMTRAGADVFVPHVGLTTKGTVGARTAMTLDDAVTAIQAMHDVARAINPDIIVLCHGGPIAEPEDAHKLGDRNIMRGVYSHARSARQ